MEEVNKDLKALARINKVPYWRIAQELGISENTLGRKLRYELSIEESEKIVSIIYKLKEE